MNKAKLVATALLLALVTFCRYDAFAADALNREACLGSDTTAKRAGIVAEPIQGYEGFAEWGESVLMSFRKQVSESECVDSLDLGSTDDSSSTPNQNEIFLPFRPCNLQLDSQSRLPALSEGRHYTNLVLPSNENGQRLSSNDDDSLEPPNVSPLLFPWLQGPLTLLPCRCVQAALSLPPGILAFSDGWMHSIDIEPSESVVLLVPTRQWDHNRIKIHHAAQKETYLLPPECAILTIYSE